MTLIICTSLILLFLGTLAARFFFNNTITWKESAIQMGIQAVLVLAVVVGSFSTNITDWKVISGHVTKKEQVKVSCEHSYSCRCRTVKSGDSYTTRCDTCYRHHNDWDWRVYSNVGQVNIKRIDSRGKKEPPRWTEVKVNEPFSTVSSFRNYVRASSDTLFSVSEDNMKFFKGVSPYPRQIYDYYKSVRVVSDGVPVDKGAWNTRIAEIQRTVWPKKRANIIFYFTKETDPSYRYAVESAWKGAKINDVVVIIGASDYPKVDWVDVITYGRNKGNELTSIMIKDKITEMGEIDIKMVNETAKIILDKFDLITEKTFEYLKDSVKLSFGQMLFIVLIQIAAFVGLTIFFHKNEI